MRKKQRTNITNHDIYEKITHILTNMSYYMPAKRDKPGGLLDLTISQQINRPGSMIVKISLAQGYRIWLLQKRQNLSDHRESPVGYYEFRP